MTCMSSRLIFQAAQREPRRGVETLIKIGDTNRLWCRILDLTPMVGGMTTYVQGSRLKVVIAESLRFFQFPDHQRSPLVKQMG